MMVVVVVVVVVVMAAAKENTTQTQLTDSFTQLDMQQDPGLLANRKEGEKLRKG